MDGHRVGAGEVPVSPHRPGHMPISPAGPSTEYPFDRVELRALVRKHGANPTLNQQGDIVKKRRKLQRDIEDYVRQTTGFLGVKAMEDLSGKDEIIRDDDVNEGEIPDYGNDTISSADPERQRLPFPSDLSAAFRNSLSMQDTARLQGLLDIEIEMRSGEANDALEAIRGALIQLSWCFKNKVRRDRTQRTRTRAWSGAQLLIEHWKKERLVYNHNRFAMAAAGAEVLVNESYPMLQVEDCVISTAVANPNTPGQSSDRLKWLWQGVGFDDKNLGNDYAVECESQ